MAYPASEMIANTIAEAINAADQMNFGDYLSLGVSAIAAFAPFLLLGWEMQKSKKERDRLNKEKKELENKLSNEMKELEDKKIIEEIKADFDEVLTLLFFGADTLNIRNNWQYAYEILTNLKSTDLLNIDNSKNEFKRVKQRFQKKLQRRFNDADPEMESLRWQFFTGVKHWQNNHETWDQIQKKVNIGSAFLHQDHFGNYYKKDGVKNISPYHALAIYNFIYAGKCPSEDDIKFPTIDTAPKTKAELTRSILIDGISPTWLNDYGNEGLIYYLFKFYTRPIDESINKIHS